MKKLLFPVFIFAIFTSCDKSSLGNKDKTTTKDLSLLTPQESKPGEEQTDKAFDTNVADSTATPSQIMLQGSPPQNVDWDKKIIKTAFLKFEVKNFKAYSDIVHKAAKQYGGYVSNEEQNQSEEKIESTISVKVPVDQFESIMDQLPSGAEKVVEKKITTEDVTGEVVDTKSRLQAKEQMRLKYLEFLKQSKNMEDVLKVQSEINGIQEEIESASGRINYLSHESAFSTINLTFFQPLAGYSPGNDNPGFVRRIIAAFKSGFNSVLEILIGIISIWPFLLFLIVVWIFIRKYINGITPVKQKL